MRSGGSTSCARTLGAGNRPTPTASDPDLPERYRGGGPLRLPRGCTLPDRAGQIRGGVTRSASGETGPIFLWSTAPRSADGRHETVAAVRYIECRLSANQRRGRRCGNINNLPLKHPVDILAASWAPCGTLCAVRTKPRVLRISIGGLTTAMARTPQCAGGRVSMRIRARCGARVERSLHDSVEWRYAATPNEEM